jgi:hypothetical protein
MHSQLIFIIIKTISITALIKDFILQKKIEIKIKNG